MDTIDALAFSREWGAGWNRRDVEAVLRHFHEDALFTSPIAMRIGFAEDGAVKGKDSLRLYWTKALAKNPGLGFKVIAVYQGVNTLVIRFKNQEEKDRVEILKFDHGLFIEGHGTFAAS